MININTADYNFTKEATIDGQKFTVRQLNSAEALQIAALSRDLKEPDADQAEIVEKILNIYYGAFTDKELAKEKLSVLPLDSVVAIHNTIMKGENA